MASIKNPSRDKWTVAIDLMGVRKFKTFKTKAEASAWADQEETIIRRRGAGLHIAPAGTVGELVERYEKELWPYRKWGDTKAYNLKKIKDQIGGKPLKSVTKQMLVDYGREMARTRGPCGVKERLSYLSEVFKAARDLWSIETPVSSVLEALGALRRLGLSGDAEARTRRLTQDEIDAVMKVAERTEKARVNLPEVINVLQYLPLRVSELCRIEWDDLDPKDRSVMIRKRKHPTKKERNDERVALPVVGGVDTYELVAGRPRYYDRPFPYLSKTVSSLFWLAHKRSGIEDIHLHDLRAHAISFMLCFTQPQIVAAISGHKNWLTMSKHYARLTPDQVHAALQRAGVDKATARANLQLVKEAA